MIRIQRKAGTFLPTLDQHHLLRASLLRDAALVRESFERWKSPQRVLELVRLAVAMRPGVPRADVEAVRRRLDAGDRIVEFEMASVAVSSTEIRARVERGETIEGEVSAKVADAIARLGLYGSPE